MNLCNFQSKASVSIDSFFFEFVSGYQFLKTEVSLLKTRYTTLLILGLTTKTIKLIKWDNLLLGIGSFL
jgi:hypothetical protein